YPAAYVRWTEQRNIQAVLDLMGSGKLDVSPLVSHRFDIAEAEKAYERIQTGREPYLGIVLRYPEYEAPSARPCDDRRALRGRLVWGCIGAGNRRSARQGRSRPGMSCIWISLPADF